MQIDITTLPKEIQKKLPLSIRTFKTVYEFDELPVPVQHIIRDYYTSVPDIGYRLIFDFIPEASEYGDFKIIDDVGDLVVEYLKNYLLITPGSYPFHPEFGCTLKYHLQTKDTLTRQTLISAEVARIVDLIKSLLRVSVYVESIDMEPISVGAYDEFNVAITLLINERRKKISIEFRQS